MKSFVLLFTLFISTSLAFPIDNYQNGEWKWYQLKGTKCANNKETGYGLNLFPGANETVLFFDGGGACWDAETCYIQDTAYYVSSGFQEEQFNRDILPQLNQNITLTLRNESINNPFRKANYVYIPYCTGDIHAGRSVQHYKGANQTTFHHGYLNGLRIIKEVSKIVPKSKRVLVSGVSAGGYGAVYHYQNTKKYFKNAHVDVWSDSAESTPFFIKSKPQWNLVHPKCKTCNRNDYNTLLTGLALDNKKSRFAALSWQIDTVLPLFFNVTLQEFVPTIDEYFQNVTNVKTDNAKGFRANGTNHVVTNHLDAIANDGTNLTKWLNEFHNLSSDWNSAL